MEAQKRLVERRTARRRSVLGLVALALVGAGLAVFSGMAAFSAAPAVAATGEVLMLDTTLTGGAGSTLAQKFVAAGKTPVVVNGATWASMTAAQFNDYDAIVLGDNDVLRARDGAVAPAAANAAVWSSVVDGNVIMIGTDETFHQSQGGSLLMEKAAAFTVAQTGKTGAYISLSCYYHGTAAMTPVPLLDGFGTFTVTGVGCFNDAHIVATHPALDGLTDATLSNWSCSVHEAFDSWPVSFEVLAIAEGIGTSFTAPDGSVGTPYILARGVEVISDIDLAPAEDTNPIGTSHTLTATVTTDDPAPGTPVVGTTVTFTVVVGPHAGTTGSGVTDSTGKATFSYTGTLLGDDTIEATFVDSLGRTQRSNRVLKHWVEGTEPEGEVVGKGTVAKTSINKLSFQVDADGTGGFLNFNGTKVRFNSTSVANFSQVGNQASFDGTGTWNGTAGYTYVVSFVDNGFPGRNDTIDLVVRNPAAAVVFTTGGPKKLGTGNITVS